MTAPASTTVPRSPVPQPAKPHWGMTWLTVFGLGHTRPASGTWGSLPPVLLVGIFAMIGVAPASLLTGLMLWLLLLVFSAVCVIFGDRAEAKWGKDASEIVADETAGMCIPLLLLPAATIATPALTVFTLVFAFLAFRAFDIAKPWPANALQRIPGGWGVLLDDLVAGLYAAIAINLISAFLL